MWDGASFSLAIDYVNVEVEDQIGQLGPSFIVSQCYSPELPENNSFCDLFTRELADPTDPDSLLGQIEFVDDPYVNIAAQRNEAIDLNARFVQDFDDAGRLSFNSQITWQLVDEIQVFTDEEAQTSNGEVGDPRWVGDFNVTYAIDNYQVNWSTDVIGGTTDLDDLLAAQGTVCPLSTLREGPVCPIYELDSRWYHNVSGTVDVNDAFSFTLGVANIFDTAPPRVSTIASPIGAFGQTPLNGSYYDYLGRRLFVNVNARF